MLEEISNSELYRLVKEAIISQQLGLGSQDEKLEDIRLECQKRGNIDLYDDAVADALQYLSENNLKGLLDDMIKNKEINSMNKYDIADLLKESINTKTITNIVRMQNNTNLANYLELYGLNENAFLCSVTGNSMKDIGINNGDTLIVSDEFHFINDKIAIISINDKLFVKRIKYINGKLWFFSANKEFLPVEADENMKIKVLGIVKKVIRNL